MSLGHLKVSDLFFFAVLVRPSLILHCAWYAIVEPLVGVSSVAVSATPVVAAQHGQPQDPLGCSKTFLAASACPAPALEAWVGSRFFFCFLSASLAQAGLAMFAGCLTLCGCPSWGIIDSFCEWLCERGCDFSLSGSVVVSLDTATFFQTLVLAMSGFAFHLLLRFAECGFECLLPCWIPSCLSGCTPFARCDIAL